MDIQQSLEFIEILIVLRKLDRLKVAENTNMLVLVKTAALSKRVRQDPIVGNN